MAQRDADELSRHIDELLAADDAERLRRYPGSAIVRQPVHTVYVPADRFNPEVIDQWRSAALSALDVDGPMPGFADLDEQIRAKLRREPIEDLRVDFEDGYGLRPDAEEDRHARFAAATLATLTDRPSFCGIRIKSLEGPVRARSIRTLRTFVHELVRIGPLPDGFRITLAKLTSVAQVRAMAIICAAIEEDSGLATGTLRFELQVETPQAILAADGTATIAPMLHAAEGRCAGLHYGTYDYSASVGISAAFQSMEHPAADYAKAVMQVAAAGTGVPVSDGSTNILPVGERSAVHAAWALHARLTRRSLERGFYQGWDLHPAQLAPRYAANYRFYVDGFPAAVDRLVSYLQRSASGVLDEPATARALAGFLLRGLDSGAVSLQDLKNRAGFVALDEPGTMLDTQSLKRLATNGS